MNVSVFPSNAFSFRFAFYINVWHVRPNENIAVVRDNVAESPITSIRDRAQEIGVSRFQTARETVQQMQQSYPGPVLKHVSVTEIGLPCDLTPLNFFFLGFSSPRHGKH